MALTMKRLNLQAVLEAKKESVEKDTTLNSPTTFIPLHLMEVQLEQAPSEGTTVIVTPRGRGGSARNTPRAAPPSNSTPASPRSPSMNVDGLRTCSECGTSYYLTNSLSTLKIDLDDVSRPNSDLLFSLALSRSTSKRRCFPSRQRTRLGLWRLQLAMHAKVTFTRQRRIHI